AAALLALVASQVGPWLKPGAGGGGQRSDSGETQTAKSRPMPPAETPSRPANSAPADSKPSPMPPPEVAKQEPSATPRVEKQPELKPPVEEPVTKSTAKEETAPVRNPLAQPPSQRPPVRAVATPQAVAIISSPGGATATLDGRPDAVCTTPCSLDASPG